jgi:hypothetical protein
VKLGQLRLEKQQRQLEREEGTRKLRQLQLEKEPRRLEREEEERDLKQLQMEREQLEREVQVGREWGPAVGGSLHY